MYSVDEHDVVQRLGSLPQSSVGAPIPSVLSREGGALVAYLVQEPNPGWDGTTCRVVGPETDGELIAIVGFVRPYAHMFGPPNDEAFSGHPLASRGLMPYGTFEVLRSSWVRRLERMNSVHPCHRRDSFAKKRHFILSFHDSTFECVAEDVRHMETLRGSLRGATDRMVALMYGPA